MLQFPKAGKQEMMTLTSQAQRYLERLDIGYSYRLAKRMEEHCTNPVLGYRTETLPAFYTDESDFKVDYRMDSPEEIAAAVTAQRDMGYPGGMLITNPIPHQYAMPKDVIDAAINQALAEAKEQGVKGKATTPFLLARVCELTGGESLKSNIKLVLNNVALGAQIASAMH